MEELAELSPPLDFSKRLLEEALVIKAKERVKMQTGGWMEWRSIFELFQRISSGEEIGEDPASAGACSSRRV